MNIEMGESLAASWLKHVKKCQIVQTNWKPSWFLRDIDVDFAKKVLVDLDGILAAEKFELFPRRKSKDASSGAVDLDVRQILGMTECDVVGVSFSNGENADCFYAFESAFHSDGLHYKATAEKVAAKLAKAILSLHLNMAARNIEVGFMTPIVKESCFANVKKVVGLIRDFFTSYEYVTDRFTCVVDLYTGCRLDDNQTEAGYRCFYQDVVRPLIMRVPLADDDSELFMRSMLMRELSHGHRLPVRSSLRSALQMFHWTVEELEKLPENRIDEIEDPNKKTALKGYRKWLTKCSLLHGDKL